MALEERAAQRADTATAKESRARTRNEVFGDPNLGSPAGSAQRAEAGAHIAQLKQRLARKAAVEETSWALDGDEEDSEAIFSEVEIPDDPLGLERSSRSCPRVRPEVRYAGASYRRVAALRPG